MLEREFQKKRKFRNRIYSQTTVVILVIVIAFLIRPTWNMYRRNVESKRALVRAAQELQGLEQKEETLNEEIQRINTNKGTEEEIRKKFGVAKEGETVVVIVGPEEKNGAAVVESSGFFSHLWSKLIGVFK